ncbi:MAG TPA: PKD domain-containing protein, partial [Chthoniobacterales bacterium]
GSDPNIFQSVARSTDAGETWTIHQVKGPGFTGAKPPPGILDPSIAIASDGTLYFAYISSEIDGGHARVAVSHDKGASWGNDFDIGASYGLANAVFATAIAGDPNRAAVGFLGTTAPGNHQGPTFAGTWYVFVAHTYDGGASWTTVNATPDDPVQKESCIWNQGGSNPCRNLLDFTGITKDDKGRVLYGYADGCIGDCVSGGPNSYSSKATIAKQSGGKSLLSTFDPAEPILPQSACLSGRRDDLGSYLKWKSPDNGGSDIQYYRIFRGETIGTMSEVGTASGKKLSFTDRSADPAVANYFYLIYAHNAQGDGAASNVIQLPLGQRLEPIQACSRPGVEVLQDPVGDATTQLMQHDITSVSIAEPENQSGKLVFVIKVRNLSPVPPNWRWAVRFNTKLAPPVVPGVGAQDDWFVSFVSGAEGAADQYTYGSTGVFQGASRVFTTIGTLDPASTRTADGYIVLVLPKNLVGNLQPGDDVTNIFGSVRLNGPTGGTNETIPDSTGTGSYKTRTANLCLPNAAPLAALEANVDSGFKPLPVQFDASGSTDPDAIDTIGSYSFNFGDGTDDVVQDCASNPNCAVIDHTFNEAGLYAVKCVATDSRGKASSNIAQVLIEVDVPFTKVVSRKLHAGVPRDIELALSGPVTTEPRDSSAEHTLQLIFTFERDITNPGSATKSQGGGSIGQATIGPASNQVTVDLSNVTDQQHVVVTLNGVHDSQNAVLDNLPARVDVLAGDTNDDGRVNIQDTNQTKANSGYVLTNDTNARVDVVNDDGRINIADTNYVKARSGHVVLSGSSPTTGKATAERAK